MKTIPVFKLLLIGTLVFAGSAFMLPGCSLAQTTVGGGAGDTIQTVELQNVAKVGSIQDLLLAILRIVMILMVPIIVFFIILAGFKYATAGGNASQVEEASRALLYAIIGGVLILGAVAISEIIKNVVSQF